MHEEFRREQWVSVALNFILLILSLFFGKMMAKKSSSAFPNDFFFSSNSSLLAAAEALLSFRSRTGTRGNNSSGSSESQRCVDANVFRLEMSKSRERCLCNIVLSRSSHASEGRVMDLGERIHVALSSSPKLNSGRSSSGSRTERFSIMRGRVMMRRFNGSKERIEIFRVPTGDANSLSLPLKVISFLKGSPGSSRVILKENLSPKGSIDLPERVRESLQLEMQTSTSG